MIKDMISIVMPTYNDAQYLSSAIEDILIQTYNNFELIIVDDGSTDNTKEILKSYSEKDDRIKLFYKENGGTGSALNLGFENANGEFGTWVSSDDNKNKNFLERLVNFLKKNRDVEYVTSAFFSKHLNSVFKPYEFLESGEKIVHLNGLGHRGALTGTEHIVDDWAHVNRVQCFQGVCFMFTMDLKKRVGKYIEVPGEDYEMLMRMALNSRCGYIDICLGTHNNPQDSLSMMDRTCVKEANRLTADLYDRTDKWIVNNIPKVANFYWGGTKMSFMRYLTIKSFKKFNPDWSIRLYQPKNISPNNTWRKAGDNHHQCDENDYNSEYDYTEKLLEEIPLKIIKVDFSNTFIKNDAPEPHKSDLLGWKVLSSTGGLWCDMDIIFFKSMSKIKINPLTDTVVCYDTRFTETFKPAYGSKMSQEIIGPNVPIGFLASSPNNLFFKSIMKNSKMCYSNGYQSIGTFAQRLVAHNIEVAKNKFSNNIFHNINHNVVYSIDHTRISDMWEKNVFSELPDETIGIHWYGGSPLTQKYNNMINHKNWDEYDSTIIEIIRKVLKDEE